MHNSRSSNSSSIDLSGYNSVFCDSTQAIEWAYRHGLPKESIIRSDGTSEDITITFTAAQKLRWNERIKKIMFEKGTVEDYVDGSFMGTISEPIGLIIQNHIVTDAVMSVDDYSAAIEKCQMELIQYISNNTKGVHVLFIINFTAHFLQTILSTVYNVGDVASDLVPQPNNNNSGNDSKSFYA